MSEFVIVSLILLGVSLIDAAGDAFRARRWQVIHHSMEVLGVATWFLIWALFEFNWLYITMYITGRIALFDLVFNLIARNKLNYIGTSSFYARILGWFTDKVEKRGHLIWVLRVMMLIWWVAWIVTRADGQFFNIQ